MDEDDFSLDDYMNQNDYGYSDLDIFDEEETPEPDFSDY